MLIKENFSFGKPCRQQHALGPDGTNLRYKNACMICQRGDKFDNSLTPDEIIELFTKPKRTPEEIKAGRVAASMRWNAKNKDKVSVYVKKYVSSEERRAAVRQKYVEHQDKVNPNRKRRKRGPDTIQRERIDRTALTAEQIENIKLERREKAKARERAKYHALTPEQRKEIIKKNNERKKAKRQREAEAKDKNLNEPTNN